MDKTIEKFITFARHLDNCIVISDEAIGVCSCGFTNALINIYDVEKKEGKVEDIVCIQHNETNCPCFTNKKRTNG